jgi:hypothetical protein
MIELDDLPELFDRVGNYYRVLRCNYSICIGWEEGEYIWSLRVVNSEGYVKYPRLTFEEVLEMVNEDAKTALLFHLDLFTGRIIGG